MSSINKLRDKLKNQNDSIIELHKENADLLKCISEAFINIRNGNVDKALEILEEHAELTA